MGHPDSARLAQNDKYFTRRAARRVLARRVDRQQNSAASATIGILSIQCGVCHNRNPVNLRTRRAVDRFVFAAAGLLLLVLIGLWLVLRRRAAITAAAVRATPAMQTQIKASTTLLAQTPPAGAAPPVADFAHTDSIRRGAIEVTEMSDLVDLDALLASVPTSIAAATRDLLDEPTIIATESGRSPAIATPPATVAVAPGAGAGASGAGAAPMSASPPPRPTISDLLVGTPLRNLALAWYQIRGYRISPASPLLDPIGCVLRHREDARRVYAVIESAQPVVDDAQIDRWLARAQAVGIGRLLVLTEAAIDPQADACKGSRILNRARLETEFARLDPGIAARIISAARALVSSSAGGTAHPLLMGTRRVGGYNT